jgi:uncharacterized membrane protein YgcG
MRKLLLTTLAVLLSISLFGSAQDTLKHKGEKSNYEKYWESKNGTLETVKPEFDDLYYQPSKDRKQKTKKDTVEKKQVIVNNYYDNDFYYANRINRFHHTYWFDYYYSPFYSPYYSWYSPYIYDSWYWGYNSWGFSWNYSFGWHSPYYGWYSPYDYRWHTPYYVHNNYYYGNNQPRYNNIQYGRRERPSNLTQNNPTASRRIAETRPQERVSPQSRPTYDQNRRTYTPSYEQPRLGTRPQYNNSRIQRDNSNVINNKSNVNVQRSIETRTQISTERRTTQPQVNRSQNYSAPVQRTPNYNSAPSMDRRSSGSNFNGGSNTSRSSSSTGSYNGGSSSSSSGSSGGRTSGGSTSSGRR